MVSRVIPCTVAEEFIANELIFSTFAFPPIAAMYFCPMDSAVTPSAIFFVSGLEAGFANLSKYFTG